MSTILAWALLHPLGSERLPLLLLVDPFAVYFFIPLPLVVLVAVRLRSRLLGVSSGLLVLLGLWLWQGFGVTHLAHRDNDRPSLRVMTFNVLGPQNNVQAAVRTVLAEDADVIMMQEVTPRLATELVRSLGTRYPYRALASRKGTWGLGTISKFPIRETGRTLSGRWGGEPQVLLLDWGNESITLVNFHMLNPPASWDLGLAVRRDRTQREAARALAEFVRGETRHRAVVAAGDLNATEVSRTYAIVTEALKDSWREAGVGLGHTFPGSKAGGLSRVRLLGSAIPRWLVRIDYVFHSSDLEAVGARTARFDGASDHRGVVVDLARPSASSAPVARHRLGVRRDDQPASLERARGPTSVSKGRRTSS